MTKTISKRSTRSPDKLAMVARKSGVELSETQLDRAKGGLIGLLRAVDVKL